MKNIVTTFAGLFAFGGVIINATNLMGLFVSTLASVLYAIVKFRESQQNAALKAQAEEEEQDHENGASKQTYGK